MVTCVRDPLTGLLLTIRGRLACVGILWLLAVVSAATLSAADDRPVITDAPVVTGPFISGGSELVEGARTPPLAEYRIRIDDNLQFFFRLVKESPAEPYHLNAGDQLRI